MTNKQIQEALRGLGLYKGEIDGKLGKDSKASIRAFQRINPPLDDDGVAGKNTLAELFPENIESVDIRVPSDPTKAQMGWPKESHMEHFYGTDETKLVMAKMPYWLRLAWETKTQVNKFRCHRLVAKPFESIFKDTLNHYGIDKIQELGLDLFGGCYNNRNKRGGTTLSAHACGIAVDLDPTRNGLRLDHTQAELAKEVYKPFWEIVESHGAVSLGRVQDFDWMHFQFARV